MAQDEPGQDPLDEDARIAALHERIARVEHQEKVRKGEQKVGEADENYRQGNRVLAELIGGIVGGSLIGWFLDRLFGTSPWLLLALLFMGIVAAFWNIIRVSMKRPKR